jgi:hypothetical protein
MNPSIGYIPFAPAPPQHDFKMMKQPFTFHIKDTFQNYLSSNNNSAQCGSESVAPDTCYPSNFQLNSKDLCQSQSLWNNSTKRKTVVKDYVIKELK